MSGFNVQLQLAGVLEWMSKQMAGCGGKTAVIGISGGKDTSGKCPPKDIPRGIFDS